jgi:hypothetical protein
MAVKRESVRERWWQFEHWRAGLYSAVRPMDRCLAMARISKVVLPSFAPTNSVFSDMVIVFAYDDDERFGVLSSGVHREWALGICSTLETRPIYTATDCFETFVQPPLTDPIATRGHALHAHRSALMLDRQEGLTKTYNRVHNPDERADDIVRLREIQIELDHAVRDAYGWSDLDLGHGFHDTKFGIRFTFAPIPRQEVRDRLLELNHERYAQEVRQGLHDKAKSKGKAKRVPAGSMTLGFDGA